MTKEEERGVLKRIGETLAETAPSIASALGGPLAGAAADALRRAIFGEDEADAEALERAVLSADPQALMAMRRADYAFRTALMEQRIEAERVASADRDSARQREIAVRDRTPAVLASAVITGFFGVLSVMLFRTVPPGAEPAFSIMLGALATMTAAVVNYYFGSSVGSREKTKMMAAPARL